MKYYANNHHQVVSNDPSRCEGCDSFREMEEISKEQAIQLLRQINEMGEFLYWNATTSLTREEAIAYDASAPFHSKEWVRETLMGYKSHLKVITEPFKWRDITDGDQVVISEEGDPDEESVDFTLHVKGKVCNLIHATQYSHGLYLYVYDPFENELYIQKEWH